LIISIQYLRAIAASMVMLYHAGRAANGHLPGDFPSFTIGAAGVDIFFVISGFVMWQSTAASPSTPGEFLRKRISRIVPLYWLATLLMCAMPFVSGTIAGGLSTNAEHLLASLAFIPWHAARDPAGVFYPVYVPGWTLNFEMVFYLIFAACLLIGHLRWRLLSVVATFSVLAIIGRAAPAHSVAAWMLAPIILEFAAGLCIGAWAATPRSLPAPLAAVLLAAGFAGLMLSGADATIDEMSGVWGIPAVAIVLGAVELERHRLVRTWTMPVLIGESSYALYLSHIFTIGFVVIAWNGLHLWDSAAGQLAFFPVTFVACQVVAIVTHLYIEQPLIGWARALLDGDATARRPASSPGGSSVRPL
jgi:exopolysaccharide production protein ExoZ